MNKLALLIVFSIFCGSTATAQATVANATNTVTANSFLGSGANNNFDIIFKRNNLEAGRISTSSVFLGVYSGLNSVGYNNVFLGYYAGISFNGTGNIAIGQDSGNSTKGDRNIFLGTQAGESSNGSGNIFIGPQVGSSTNVSNKLLIDNNIDEFSPVLIWGDFEQRQLKFNSKVGIGNNANNEFGSYPTTAGSVDVSNYNLFVRGGILTEEVRVTLQSEWADYVFEKDYKLTTLDEVERHIKEKGHLINVPSAKEIKENGIELGEMAKIQQEKIEELTLYIIELNKKVEAQEKRINELAQKQ